MSNPKSRAARQQNYQFAYHAVPQFLFRSDFASTIPMTHPDGFAYWKSLWSKMAVVFPQEHVVQDDGITSRAYRIGENAYALLVAIPLAEFSLEASHLIVVFRPEVEYLVVGNGIDKGSPSTLRRVNPSTNERCGSVFDLEDEEILNTICKFLGIEPDIRPAGDEEFRRLAASVPQSVFPPGALNFDDVWEVAVAYRLVSEVIGDTSDLSPVATSQLVAQLPPEAHAVATSCLQLLSSKPNVSREDVDTLFGDRQSVEFGKPSNRVTRPIPESEGSPWFWGGILILVAVIGGLIQSAANFDETKRDKAPFHEDSVLKSKQATEAFGAIISSITAGAAASAENEGNYRDAFSYRLLGSQGIDKVLSSTSPNISAARKGSQVLTYFDYLKSVGEVERAYKLLDRGIESVQSAVASSPTTLGLLLYYRAQRKHRTQQFDAAEKDYSDALTQLELAGAKEIDGRTFDQLDDEQVALSELWIACMLDYAWLLAARTQFFEAELLLSDCEQMIDALRRKNYSICAGYFARRSRVLNMRGDSEAALENLKHSTELLARNRSEMSGAEFCYAAKEVIELFQTLGKVDSAIDLSEESLDAAKEIYQENSPDFALALYSHARVLKAASQTEAAFPHFEQALDIALDYVEASALALPEREQLSMKNRFDGLFCEYVLSASRFSDSKEVVQRIVRWKSAVFARQRALRDLAKESDEFGKLSTLSQNIAAIRCLPPEHITLDLEDRLVDLMKLKDRIEAKFLNQLEFRVVPPALEEVQASIPNAGVLVDYTELSDGTGVSTLVASIIKHDGYAKLVDLGDASQLESRIKRWRDSYGTSSDSKLAADQLRRQIWEPIQAQVEGAEIVIVSHDGFIDTFPIAALPGANNGSFLIEEYRIVTMPGPQLLPSLKKERSQDSESHSMIAVGNVDYDQPVSSSVTRSERWSPLPGTLRELESISHAYQRFLQPNATLRKLESASASESQFRKEANSVNVIHLATHGFYNPDSHFGMSGIVLAGANQIQLSHDSTPVDDGILSADEILFWPTDDLQLVVLSACESRLGAMQRSEGMLGIERAFLIAGADSVIASLWSVDDRATSVLMGNSIITSSNSI